jgi:ubiquinone/menaquinone biosynthesis C-methylase UbiE
MAEEERYLHGHHDSVLRSHRWRTAENSAAYFLSVLEPDWIVLDVGCGPGTITADLSAKVPDGKVIGVDASAVVLREALRTAPTTPFLAADLYALPFEDASVDAIHLHMVLQHVSDPIGAFRVLRRVLKPGGVIAARDSDYGSFSWTPASPAVDRWLELYRQVARRVGGDPDAGRYLRAWALEAGYRVEASESTWVYETPEEREWWGSLWAERVEASDFADAVEAEGLASREELTALAEGWRTWAASPEGRFAVPCGEVLCWS